MVNETTDHRFEVIKIMQKRCDKETGGQRPEMLHGKPMSINWDAILTVFLLSLLFPGALRGWWTVVLAVILLCLGNLA